MNDPKHAAHQGAEPQVIAEVVGMYGDPEAFAERELRVLVNLQKLPIGTKLVALTQGKQQAEQGRGA